MVSGFVLIRFALQCCFLMLCYCNWCCCSCLDVVVAFGDLFVLRLVMLCVWFWVVLWNRFVCCFVCLG